MKKNLLIAFLVCTFKFYGQQPQVQPEGVLAFEYDAAGNQILRKYTKIAGKHSSKSIKEVTKNLITSDIYNDIKYYPNPVQNELYIKWENLKTITVEEIQILNSFGQIVFSCQNLKLENSYTVDFKNYSTGYYNVVLLYSNNTKKNLKIIKETFKE